MRPSYAAAALGLFASHVLAQYNAFGWTDDVAPRYWHEAAAEAPVLAKRDGDCSDGKHPCSDINSTLCCFNTQYCIVNSTTWEPKCCPLGSTCGEDCDASQYPINITTTITISSTVTVRTDLACAGRKCTSTLYECPSSMGGDCCPFGSNCGFDSSASRGICLATASSSTASASAVVSLVPSGCTAQGQTYCATGGGCCDAGYACTLVSSSPMCSRTTATATATGAKPTGSGVTLEHEPHGLSAGAKAGIAVGVVAAAALVIGALTWVCVRRRRSARRSDDAAATTTTAQEMDTNPDRGARARARATTDDGAIPPYGAAGGPHMSEADGYSHSHGYAPSSTQVSHRGALTSDYFGPGPQGGGAEQRRAVSPEFGQTGRGDAGGAPVEIGAHDPGRRPRPHSRMSSQDSGDGSQSELADTSSGVLRRGGSLNRHEAAAGNVRDSIAERVFELYGSEVPASPGAASFGGGGGGEVYHDAPEGRMGVVGSPGVLPQPLPTPRSEMSEFATPSPMSREE